MNFFGSSQSMNKTFWKTLPLLSMALALGAQDPEFAARDKAKNGKQQPACGLVEGDQCRARVMPKENGGLLDFALLYWRAENQGFYSAWHQTSPFVAVGAARSSATSVVRPEAAWDLGFRVGAGWNTAHDQWAVVANWTWYKNHATNTSTQSDITAATADGRGFYPVNSGLFSSGGLVGPYLACNTSWKLWLNAVDLELARSYYLTKTLLMKTCWGARGASLKQKFHSTFTSPSAAVTVAGAPSPSPALSEEAMRQKNKFWGVGPRAGVEADWTFGKGVSLVGRGAVSLLFGQQKWSSKDKTLESGNAIATNGAKSGGMYQTLAPNLQLFLGLKWGGYFSCDTVYCGVDIGWEANYWWNQYAIATMTSNVASGSPVTMEGLTANFHIDF